MSRSSLLFLLLLVSYFSFYFFIFIIFIKILFKNFPIVDVYFEVLQLNCTYRSKFEVYSSYHYNFFSVCWYALFSNLFFAILLNVFFLEYLSIKSCKRISDAYQVFLLLLKHWERHKLSFWYFWFTLYADLKLIKFYLSSSCSISSLEYWRT